MSKTHPVSISCETHGLAGNLVLPEAASAESPVLAAVFVGGPGPVPLTRYSESGAKQWPVIWSEAMGQAGLGALCYDQRGSGLSSGAYPEADWDGLFEDARAMADMLSLQPEVSRTAAVAWGEGCSFALQLAMEDRVDAVILLAPPYRTAEERYARQIKALAASKSLPDRVVQVRLNQWKREILAAARRVQQGETTSTTDLGGKAVTTNLVRFLQTVAYNPADVVPHVRVPALLLHGQDDTAISPAESDDMSRALPGPAQRITYPGVAHFLYREDRAVRDAIQWLKQTVAH